MPSEAAFATLFAELRGLLQPYAVHLVTSADGPAGYSLDTTAPGPNCQPMFFGAARIGKRYVSYHLMPVYTEPALLDGISPELRRRMQGKSCFNFTKLTPALRDELAALTARGYAAFRAAGLIGPQAS